MPIFLETMQKGYRDLLFNSLINQPSFSVLHHCKFLTDCRAATITLLRDFADKARGYIACEDAPLLQKLQNVGIALREEA